ncbi:hypothetical protein MTO96_020101 [Rhipicephalus appendiculatus]
MIFRAQKIKFQWQTESDYLINITVDHCFTAFINVPKLCDGNCDGNTRPTTETKGLGSVQTKICSRVTWDQEVSVLVELFLVSFITSISTVSTFRMIHCQAETLTLLRTFQFTPPTLVKHSL